MSGLLHEVVSVWQLSNHWSNHQNTLTSHNSKLRYIIYIIAYITSTTISYIIFYIMPYITSYIISHVIYHWPIKELICPKKAVWICNSPRVADTILYINSYDINSTHMISYDVISHPISYHIPCHASYHMSCHLYVISCHIIYNALSYIPDMIWYHMAYHTWYDIL